MALVLSGSIDISGSMTATTILISSPGAAGMVSSSAQITELAPLMQSTASINNLTGSLITTSSNNVIAIDGLNTYTSSLKAAAIVSSSQQITNYFTFAKTGSANTFYGNQTITGSLFISGSGGNPSQAIQIIRDTVGNGTVVEESNMAITILSAPGQTKLAMGASNAGNYGYIQAMQDGTSWPNRSLTLQPRGGDVTISNGNLVMGTSGKGIDFSATSNSSGTMGSELLNDYEEGTWTPTLTCDTSPSGVAYSDRYGKYTKIGRVVHIQFIIGLTSKGTGTGDSFISGLPFTVANDMGSGEPACVNISLCTGLSTSVYVLAGWADNGSTNIQLRKTTAASTTYPQSYLTTTDISDSLYIQGSVTYHV
jgi:hypothetical protein